MKPKLPSKSFYFASESTKPLEMFRKLIERTNFVASVYGCGLFSPDFSVHSFKFYKFAVEMIFFYFINCYDLYLFSNDLVRFCFLLMTFAVALQAINKVYTLVYLRSTMLNLCERVEKFLTNFNTDKVEKIFDKWIMVSAHVFLITIIVFLGGILLIYIYPLIFYAIMGEKILHFGFELPIIDWRTTTGYILNFIYVGALGFIFVPGMISTCFLNTVFIIMAFGQYEVLNLLLLELNELITGNENGERSKEIKDQIRLIAQMHYELME